LVNSWSKKVYKRVLARDLRISILLFSFCFLFDWFLAQCRGCFLVFLGHGGLVNAAGGIAQDLAGDNYLGAIQKAGASYNTFKNGKLQQVARSEINSTLYNATLQAIPGNPRSDRYFPDAGSTPGPAGAGSLAGTGKANPAPVESVKR
jgi:hypothetical protein